MATVSEAMASFERNIETQTGKSVTAWAEVARESGSGKHGAIVAWLKSEHGLTHSHANHIAKRALEAASPRSADDPVAHLFEGGKEPLRPIYDRLAAEATRLGPDVGRRKQFALIQPTTRIRVDLGLILPGREPQGRLEPSGSFNAMFTHRIKLASADEIDAEVLTWLREAYDAGN